MITKWSYAKAKDTRGGKEAFPESLCLHEVRSKTERGPDKGQDREGQVQEVQGKEAQAHTQRIQGISIFYSSRKG